MVRRDKPRGDGSPWILKITPLKTVALNGTSVPVDRMVHVAWGDLAPPVTSKTHKPQDKSKIRGKFKDRPRPLYPDGRVLHVSEYFAELLAARLDP